MDVDLTGQTALITGASSGIGKAIAMTFAKSGADVSICSRSLENVRPVANQINSTGDTRALATECDVRQPEAVSDYVNETVNTFGSVDVLVNNAAGTFRAPFEELSENAWRTIFDINVHGAFHCLQAAGEHMRENGGGNIINISSVAALGPSPRTSHYGASKAALSNLTETLSVEWAEENVRVNGIAPGLVATPPVKERLGITDAELPDRDQVDRSLNTNGVSRQIGHPDDIADIALFLVSPASAYITGETLVARGVPPTHRDD